MLLKRKNLNDQVIEIILEKIKTGEIKPGEKLESQDELAVKLGVSRTTVREAFSKLIYMGVIESLQGQGTFVKKEQDFSFLDILGQYMILDRDSVIHVLEVRKIIEQYTVRAAAEKAKPEDIKRLEQYQDKLEKLLENPAAYNKVDKEFHLEIARISKNPVLYRILNIILNSFHEQLSSSVIVPGSLTISISTIKAMLQYIKDRDIDGATEQMTRHLDGIVDKTKQDLEQ